MSIRAKICIWLTVVLMVSAVVGSWASGGIVSVLINDSDAVTRVAALKEFFGSCGAFAPLVYFVFVVAEVVIAPLPGVMLYAPGGIVFGPWLGGAIALLGNIAGAGLACSITRTFGHNLLNRFFEPRHLEGLQQQIESRGMLLVFLLRLNPLTSSDIVSYGAGFTRMPVWKVMLATGCGMAPLCFAQAWLADSLMTAFPGLIYPLGVAGAIYAIVVVIVLRRLVTAAA